MRTCTIDSCHREHDARGLCKMHYRQQQGAVRYLITCVICGNTHRSARRAGKYCSDACKAVGYTKPKPPPRRREVQPPVCLVWVRDCAWCGRLHVGRMPHGETCSEQCKVRRGRARRRAREYNADGTFTWTQVIRLWLLLDKRCAYCNHPVTNPEPDHVTPLSRGGSNSIGNILPCCPGCNSDKRDLTLTQWAADRQRRGLPPRRTTWQHNDPRFAHLHEPGGATQCLQA